MFRILIAFLLALPCAPAVEFGGKDYGATVTVADGYGWEFRKVGDDKAPGILLSKDGGQKVIAVALITEPFEKQKSLANFSAGMATTVKGIEFQPAADYEFQGKKVESRDLKQQKADGTTIMGMIFVAPAGPKKTLTVTMMSGILSPRENQEFMTIVKSVKLR